MAYTINLTTNQEAGLAYAAAQDEVKLSPALYLQARVGEICDNYFKQSYSGRVVAVKAALEAKPDKIAEVEALLKTVVVLQK